jgi:L-alanine-DL-glutamate epimerase-like enolase superfamily enzyme
MTDVASVRCTPLTLPLHTPFVTALRRTEHVVSLLVEVRDSDGTLGLGEAPQVWAVTGESVAGAAACIEDVLAPLVVGRDVDDWLDVCRSLPGGCARNFGAKAALDAAVHDLAARRLGMPLAHLLASAYAGYADGGPDPSLVVRTDVTLSAGEPADLAEAARARVAQGFEHLKVKVGTDAARDLARVRAVREAVGPDVAIRLDANQGWTREEAVAVVKALDAADLGVEIVEQPVAGEDVEGLAWVRERVGLPILADEAVYGWHDLERVIRLGAADAVNVKLAKCGGLEVGARLLRRAREVGLGTMVGSMMESHVGVGAAASLVAAVGTSLVSDLDAAWWLAATPYAGGPAYSGPVLKLSEEPGLGLTVGATQTTLGP